MTMYILRSTFEEFECVARDTKLSKEEARDIANVGEEALKDLDASGIIQNWCGS